MHSGWIVAAVVKQGGRSKRLHFVVALGNAEAAVQAVATYIGAGAEQLELRGAVEPRQIEAREMQAGEIFQLGAKRRRRTSGSKAGRT